jgi:MYXO-CTERM domain-containing protein
MQTTPPEDKAGRLESGLLLAALAFYGVALPLCAALFRPGYSNYDDCSTLDQVQFWREGGSLDIRFAHSSLHRALCALLVRAGGPHLYLLHLPAMAAVLLESVLLFAWLKGRLGERAALWAALADLVCAATFTRAGSLLAVSLMPALFLAHALALERARERWQAGLLGLSGALVLLDYEGWPGALCLLVPYAFWAWRGRPGLRPAALLGAAAGAAIVLALTPDLGPIFHTRAALSAPGGGYAGQVWTNLGHLLGGGHRLAISAPEGHPWPPPWIWPLALLGAAPAVRRWPILALFLALGCLPLAMDNTDYEPHRLCLAYLMLAAFTGAGAALLWRRAWGRWLCLLLLMFGAADETLAWVRVPEAFLELSYGPSLDREAAVAWLGANAPAGGWDLISGLGPDYDGNIRFLMDQAGVGGGGRVPVALVTWNYRPALEGLAAAAPARSFGSFHPLLLFFPAPESAARLRRVGASLADIHAARHGASSEAILRVSARWLGDPAHRDPWARTVAWDNWLLAGLQMRSLDPGGLRRMLAEPLVCAWAPDELAQVLAPRDPVLALRFREKAEAIEPRRRSESVLERGYRY